MTEMTIRSTYPESRADEAGTRFVLLWIVLTTIAWGVAFPLGKAFAEGLRAPVAGAISVASALVASCWLQCFLLFRFRAASIAWASSAPLTIACFAVPAMIFPHFDLGLAVALGGPVLAFFQWLALRRRIAQAGWWALAVTVGWYAGGLLSGAVDPSLGVWIIGALNGSITGIVLRALLDLPASRSMRS